MKKIALFTAVSLMTSVAFGQVQWGKFEKSLHENARAAVQELIDNDSSLCATVFRKANVPVTSVSLVGQEEVVFSINFNGGYLKASAVIVNTDYIKEEYIADQFHCQLYDH